MEPSETLSNFVSRCDTPDEKLMQEDSFGSVMPILTFDSFDEIYSLLSEKPILLALYLFSESKTDSVPKIKNSAAFFRVALFLNYFVLFCPAVASASLAAFFAAFFFRCLFINSTITVIIAAQITSWGM